MTNLGVIIHRFISKDNENIVLICFNFEFTGIVERDYLMWSYFNNGDWDYLEMFMLLSEEITEFDVEEEDKIEYPDLLLSLVIARCPVG